MRRKNLSILSFPLVASLASLLSAGCAEEKPNDSNADGLDTSSSSTDGSHAPAPSDTPVSTVPGTSTPTSTGAPNTSTPTSTGAPNTGAPSTGAPSTGAPTATAPTPDPTTPNTGVPGTGGGAGEPPVSSTDPAPIGGGGAGGGETTPGSGGTGGASPSPDPEPDPNAFCPYSGGAEPSGQNWIGGELIEFNDNGGWCWYQDERVIVDQEAGKMIIGSAASGGGRDRRIEVVHWDLATNRRDALHHIGTSGYTDDHDVPAIIKRPDGGYVAMWAGHNDDCNSYYHVYDGSAWSATRQYVWTAAQGCPTPSNRRITYANLWYLGDRLYSYVRSIETSPHYLYSDDHGASWTLGGRLTSTPTTGYVAGYYKYWGNNTDRLDFFGTEAHPRDNNNSLYHGYIQDGKIHDSNGQVVDQDFTDRSAQDVSRYSTVFRTGTTINGVALQHMWNADLVRYDDGTIAAIGQGRVSGTGSDDPDKRLLYFRFDGTEWKTTYLAKAGTKLYSSEQDYTGLGALHPDNPHVIYISTSYDPRTDQGSNTGKKEIWKGVTCDDGATFEWEPVTANSQMDNIRPVVPKWSANNTALLWMRGSYSSAQSYSMKIVGLIEER